MLIIVPEVLGFPDIAITFLTTLVAVFVGFTLAVWWDRRKENEARKESLSQIRSSLKSELETNLRLLQRDEFKIWAEAPSDEKGNIVILIRPLKTSAFELVAGREDLKYLQPPQALGSISKAYDQIKDFNGVLESWLRRGVYEEEKGHYSFHGEVDLSVITTKHLTEQKKETIAKINEALEVL